MAKITSSRKINIHCHAVDDLINFSASVTSCYHSWDGKQTVSVIFLVAQSHFVTHDNGPHLSDNVYRDVPHSDTHIEGIY